MLRQVFDGLVWPPSVSAPENRPEHRSRKPLRSIPCVERVGADAERFVRGGPGELYCAIVMRERRRHEVKQHAMARHFLQEQRAQYFAGGVIGRNAQDRKARLAF